MYADPAAPPTIAYRPGATLEGIDPAIPGRVLERFSWEVAPYRGVRLTVFADPTRTGVLAQGVVEVPGLADARRLTDTSLLVRACGLAAEVAVDDAGGVRVSAPEALPEGLDDQVFEYLLRRARPPDDFVTPVYLECVNEARGCVVDFEAVTLNRPPCSIF